MQCLIYFILDKNEDDLKNDSVFISLKPNKKMVKTGSFLLAEDITDMEQIDSQLQIKGTINLSNQKIYESTNPPPINMNLPIQTQNNSKSSTKFSTNNTSNIDEMKSKMV